MAVAVWRWPCGGGRVAVAVWRWPCGGGHVAVAVWRWPCGGGRVAVAMWRWPCGGGRVAVAVWRWPCGGHMTCHVTWQDNPLRVTKALTDFYRNPVSIDFIIPGGGRHGARLIKKFREILNTGLGPAIFYNFTLGKAVPR